MSRMRWMVRSPPPYSLELSSRIERVVCARKLYARFIVIGISVALLGGVAWAALAPIALDSRNELFEIPKGTYARRAAGENVGILPETITLTLGINDVLLLRNLDDAPQMFGPALIMPGQSFSLPFEVASTYSFTCTAHASGQMLVIVHPKPEPGWQSLQWRFTTLVRRWRLAQSTSWQTQHAALGSGNP